MFLLWENNKSCSLVECLWSVSICKLFMWEFPNCDILMVSCSNGNLVWTWFVQFLGGKIRINLAPRINNLNCLVPVVKKYFTIYCLYLKKYLKIPRKFSKYKIIFSNQYKNPHKTLCLPLFFFLICFEKDGLNCWCVFSPSIVCKNVRWVINSDGTLEGGRYTPEELELYTNQEQKIIPDSL